MLGALELFTMPQDGIELGCNGELGNDGAMPVPLPTQPVCDRYVEPVRVGDFHLRYQEVSHYSCSILTAGLLANALALVKVEDQIVLHAVLFDSADFISQPCVRDLQA